MKRYLHLIASLLVFTFCQAQDGLDKSATQLAREMMPGWNLGNTMEASLSGVSHLAIIFNNKSGLSSETAWQGTKTTQEIIDYVRECGFKSIRIPCSWVLGHIADSATYKIDPVWMARVREVVDYGIRAGLYVILNDHWDGGWLEDNIDATGELEARNKVILETIWNQIANEFKDYDEHLIFAGLNEPKVDQESVVSKLVEYEQIFINTVRKSGGNNEKRLLVVQGPATDVEKTCNWLSGQMPSDPIGGKLAVEVHIYYPWQFWGMTKDETWSNMFYYWGKDNHVNGSTHNATFGEEAEITRMADRLKEHFVDKGIPVINGEYGVVWRTIKEDGEIQEKHRLGTDQPNFM